MAICCSFSAMFAAYLRFHRKSKSPFRHSPLVQFCLCIYLYKHLSCASYHFLYIDNALLARAESPAQFFSFSVSFWLPFFSRSRRFPLCTFEFVHVNCTIHTHTYTITPERSWCERIYSYVSSSVSVLLQSGLSLCMYRTHDSHLSDPHHSECRSTTKWYARTQAHRVSSQPHRYICAQRLSSRSTPDRSFNILFAHLTSPKTFVGETHLFIIIIFFKFQYYIKLHILEDKIPKKEKYAKVRDVCCA